MLLITNAEINGYLGKPEVVDVLCNNGVIQHIDKHIDQTEVFTIDAKGNALLPGLHDNHMHLLALAASVDSIDCGPPAINNRTELKNALQNHPREWIRGINYHESVASDLDRWLLDDTVPDKPVRIQHRSGIVWYLNTAALAILKADNENIEGLERDRSGQLTGRLFRLDHWLRNRLGSSDLPDIQSTSNKLASFGVTGITDTSPFNDGTTLKIFQQAQQDKHLKQKVLMMGNEDLPQHHDELLQTGHLKIMLDEANLPDFETLINTIKQQHNHNRGVAFHCVTKTEMVFALSLLTEAGTTKIDRIEHASVCTDDLLPLLKESGVTVVTQPGLLASRGNQYETDVEPELHHALYRCQSFIKENIPLLLSTDAPYGNADPWQAMQAAVKRSNSKGYVFSEEEKLTAEQALCGFLNNPENIDTLRVIKTGESADLCLLGCNWGTQAKTLKNEHVIATVVNGEIVFQR